MASRVLLRFVWLSAVWYVGPILMIVAMRRHQTDLWVINPLTHIGLMAGIALTPWANVILIALGVLSVVYLKTRVPAWSCVLLLPGIMLVTYLCARFWVVGAR